MGESGAGLPVSHALADGDDPMGGHPQPFRLDLLVPRCFAASAIFDENIYFDLPNGGLSFRRVQK